MARLLFTSAIKRASPPWLRRAIGGAIMESIGTPIETALSRTQEGAKLRFPTGVSDHDSALGYIGRERRIRRGPLESAITYARRLRLWWDAHKIRGGPYALLEQLYAFFLATLNVRMDVVYHSGTRRWIDEDGVITRDAIAWNADGSTEWAQFWLFFYLEDAPPSTRILPGGDPRVLPNGDLRILPGGTSALGVLAEEEAEIFRAIPREWSAAHVKRITIVQFWPGAELWGYPQPVGTWAENDPEPGQVWQEEDPAILLIEEN